MSPYFNVHTTIAGAFDLIKFGKFLIPVIIRSNIKPTI
jgi:hypothetical protein